MPQGPVLCLKAWAESHPDPQFVSDVLRLVDERAAPASQIALLIENAVRSSTINRHQRGQCRCAELGIDVEQLPEGPTYRAATEPDMDLADKQVLTRIADAIRDAGVDPKDLGAVQRIKYYEGFHKTEDGDHEVVPMVSLKLDPTWNTGPAWPVVQPGKPAAVRATTAKRAVVKGWHKAFIVPDVQIGFHRDPETGELDPYHDEAAIDVMLAVMRDVRPDVVVLLGDTGDFPEASSYEQKPSFQQTTQPTLDRVVRLEAQIASAAPESERKWLLGNHEERLARSVVRNAMWAFGLRPGDSPPDAWPAMSVQNLCRTDDYGFDVLDGYPANYYPINDNLIAIHGVKVNSRGSTASRVIENARVSVIYGHVHRIERMVKTRDVYHGGERSARHNFAACPGCLCRTDGAVPSTKSGTDAFGRSVPAVEDWQQGFAVVTFEEGDGRFRYEQVEVFDGWCMYRDREYRAGGREAP